nr:hypothetical protein [uncultured Allomuricauda sp.]
MEKLQKYFLSLFILMFLFSCFDKKTKLSQEEIRQKAEKIYAQALKHPQGSPECMNLIEQAILIDSTYAEAIRELSIAYLKRGMPHKWKTLIDKAVHFDAKTWLPVRGSAYLISFRNYEKAIMDLNAADTLTPNFVDYTGGHSFDYWRAIAYLGLKDYKRCIQVFDKHINKETDDVGEDWVEINAFLYRGIAKKESGDLDGAMKDFRKIIHYFKTSADAKYQMAKILASRSQKDSARIVLKEAQEDFKSGYFNHGVYMERHHQVYLDELQSLEKEL